MQVKDWRSTMKLYLTGGTGFLGSNIMRVAREEHACEVFSTINTWSAAQPPDDPVPVDFAYARVDIGDRDALMRSIREFRPDVIIHSAILNDFVLMYRDRALAWKLYVESTHHLVDAANEAGCKIILISSDWVFDGTQLGADEATPPNPVNYYGVLKVAAERVIAERAHNGAVARVAGVNGVHWLRRNETLAQNAGFGYFATAVLTDLRHTGGATIWSGSNINMRATPSLASESARMIMRIVDQDKQGIFHCTGGEAIGRPEFACLIAETFGYDPSSIALVAPKTGLPNGVRIPYDTSVSAVWTARELGYRLPKVIELIAKLKEQITTGVLA
jgi:dTDP-4-dehydrorhamnose reductase